MIGSYIQDSIGNRRYFQPPYRSFILDYELLQYTANSVDKDSDWLR